MTVRIRSLVASGPLLVPLTGGEWARLAPGEVTEELPDVEVANNLRIDKLRRRRLIEVEPVAEQAPEDESESDSGAASDSDTDSDTEPDTGSGSASGTRQRRGGSRSGKQ